MIGPAIVAVITDGEQFWTELFHGDSPVSTFTHHVDAKRWPSLEEARDNSPWWPSGESGAEGEEEQERMHRAVCSWSSCTHRVVCAIETEVADNRGPW